jgi:transposase-like protein
MIVKQEIENLEDIMYALHLYFNGLSLRNTQALSRFIKRSHHTAIRDWVQKYNPERLSYSNTKTSEFLYILKYETHLKVCSEVL